MNVADAVLIGALIVGTSFTLLLLRGLIQVYRVSDPEQRRLVLTRGLPLALVVLVVPVGGAVVGNVTGNGAFVGALVAIIGFMGLMVPLLLGAIVFEVVRGARRES